VDMHGKQTDGHGLILVTNYGSYQPKLVMHVLLHALVHVVTNYGSY